uniref:Growth factor receptor domain-containing protein n=1 Tax=Poecilia reticulata TaxID=8081 RepID=A0A3P9NUF4_POERE
TCFGPQALDCSSCFQGADIDCRLGHDWNTANACDSSCLTCDEKKSQCLSCPDGHYLESGTCRLNCSLRAYPADDGTCRRCPPHCDVCSDDRTCFSDLSDLCPMGYYEDMEEGLCTQCHPTCGSCSGPLSDDCETCSTFSPKLYKGSCLKDCPEGTYYETSAVECQGELPNSLGFCLPCDHVCSSCTGASPRDCLACSVGYLRLFQLCVLHCPTGYKTEARPVCFFKSALTGYHPNTAACV